jgi:Na+/proline symporter
MTMERWLDIAAAVFALAAAVFWFLSAYGKLPPMVAYWDQTPSNDPFYLAVKFSAQVNRWAAGLSGLSALCMAARITTQH